MPLPHLFATGLIAALCALMLMWLSLRVIKCRGENNIALGDGNHNVLRQRIRAQANFTEYTPIFLILLALAEYNGLPPVTVYLIGSAFLSGRLAHSYGLTSAEQHRQDGTMTGTLKHRKFGMKMTFFCYVILAFILMVQFVYRAFYA